MKSEDNEKGKVISEEVKSEKGIVISEGVMSEKSKVISEEVKSEGVKSEKRDTLAEIRKALQKKSDTQTEITPAKKPDTTKSTIQAKINKEPISFRVQIMAVTRILPENAPDFKGEKNLNYIKVGNFYKYSVGEFSTKEEAAKELIRVKKKFPQAFIIKVENEN
ncbi:MAG: SPOR domain-containing protein [Clostridia bacterium]|nr:SPOR domain-containing protein [Clostridia bacterium]